MAMAKNNKISQNQNTKSSKTANKIPKSSSIYQVIDSKSRIQKGADNSHPKTKDIVIHFTNGKTFTLKVADKSTNKSELQLGSDMFSLHVFNPKATDNATRKGSRADAVFGNMKFDTSSFMKKK